MQSVYGLIWTLFVEKPKGVLRIKHHILFFVGNDLIHLRDLSLLMPSWVSEDSQRGHRKLCKRRFPMIFVLGHVFLLKVSLRNIFH